MYEHLYVYPELLRVLYDRGTIPGVRIRPCKKFAGAAAGAGTGTAFVYLPGDFCEFCKTSIPVPGTSGSSVRFSYPCSEYTNPTENSLSRTVTRLYMRDFFLDGDIIFGPRLTVATTPIRHPNPSSEACLAGVPWGRCGRKGSFNSCYGGTSKEVRLRGRIYARSACCNHHTIYVKNIQIDMKEDVAIRSECLPKIDQ